MELTYIFRTLYRKRWIILSCMILAMGTAFLLTLNSKKMYKSWAQLSTGFTVSEDLKLSNDIFNLSQIDVKFNNVIENITSPKVLSLLSYRLILHDLTSSTPFRQQEKVRENMNRKPELRDLNLSDKATLIAAFEGKRDSMLLPNPAIPRGRLLIALQEAYDYDIESIRKYLSVSRYQRTDYINVIFLSENPDLSAFVVNTLISEFQRYFGSFRRQKSDESIAGLDSLVKAKKQEIDQKVAIKTQFLTDSAVLNTNVEASNLQQISQFETSLAEEQGRVQNFTYLIQQLDKQIKTIQSGSGKINGNNSGDLNNNDEYIILRKQYNDLYNEYIKKGSNDPEIKRRLDELQQKMIAKVPVGANNQSSDLSSLQLENLVQRKIDAEGQLKSAEIKIAYYQRNLSQLKRGMSSQASKAANLQQIDKEIEIVTSEYSSAKDKLNMAFNMTEATANFKQTMFGQPAYKPEPSKRLIILGLSGFSTLVLVCAVFIFIQFFDQSIKTPSQFERITGLKLLGITNWIATKGQRLSEHVIQEQADEDVNRSNSFRELLRKLRFEIEHSGKRIFLFTSTEPQQGKTTLIEAIAFSLSLGKKRVLILDTNFCNNDITTLNSAAPVLEEFSARGQEVDLNDFLPFISKTDVENVDIIGCKGGDYTPSEILPKNHLLNYLPVLLKIYDYIFMEGAPLNGYTDSKELMQYAEGVVSIFSARLEVRQSDKESIKFLRSLGDKFLGGVLNKVEKPNINS